MEYILYFIGTISSNGESGPEDCGGASGGSVWIMTSKLSGNGQITAHGGAGQC